MLEKIKKLKIQFISFKEKNRNKNKDEKINWQKVKEVRTLSIGSSFSRNWIYEFFGES